MYDGSNICEDVSRMTWRRKDLSPTSNYDNTVSDLDFTHIIKDNRKQVELTKV